MTPPPTLLHLPLQQTNEEIFEPDSVSEAPLVRFSAYAAHHRIFGWVRLRADRLTDLLNAHDELLLSDVEIEDLDDGTRRSVGVEPDRDPGSHCRARLGAAGRRHPPPPDDGRIPSSSAPAPTSSRVTCMSSRAPIRWRACVVARRWSR